MTRASLALCCAFLMAGCGGEVGVEEEHAGVQASELRPDGKGFLTRDAEAAVPSGEGKPGGGATSSNGINYHNGPVLKGDVNAYVIWYGAQWSDGAKAILRDLLANVGGSPYMNINATYYDTIGGIKTAVSGNVRFPRLDGGASEVVDPGTSVSLSDADIQAIVASHLGIDLPMDANGVYFVLTSKEVAEPSGFCTSYCGWHTHGVIGGLDIKYAFVGNPDRCLSACAAQTTSPNGDPGADGAASIVAHELEEAITDPDLNAWYDRRGQENADKCAWTFGTTYLTANGAKANLQLGTRDYLIQRNWVNASGGYCALSYP